MVSTRHEASMREASEWWSEQERKGGRTLNHIPRATLVNLIQQQRAKLKELYSVIDALRADIERLQNASSNTLSKGGLTIK